MVPLKVLYFLLKMKSFQGIQIQKIRIASDLPKCRIVQCLVIAVVTGKIA